MSETKQAGTAPEPAYIDADSWGDPEPERDKARRRHPFNRRQAVPDGRRLIFTDQAAAERFVAGLQ